MPTCVTHRFLALCPHKQEQAVSQSIRHDQTTRASKAVAVTRAQAGPAALATIILSVLLVLLSGAVWTQLT